MVLFFENILVKKSWIFFYKTSLKDAEGCSFRYNCGDYKRFQSNPETLKATAENSLLVGLSLKAVFGSTYMCLICCLLKGSICASIFSFISWIHAFWREGNGVYSFCIAKNNNKTRSRESNARRKIFFFPAFLSKPGTFCTKLSAFPTNFQGDFIVKRAPVKTFSPRFLTPKWTYRFSEAFYPYRRKNRLL